jgi:uncharacterized protein (DUF885 family)
MPIRALAQSALAATTCAVSLAPPGTIAQETTPPARSGDARFATLSKRWLDGVMRENPVWATRLGDHRFDGELDDLSAAGRHRRLTFNKQVLRELEAIDSSKLTPEDQVDAAILRNELRGTIWDLATDASWAWNPLDYSDLAGSAIYGLVARDYAPWSERLVAVASRMEKIPALLAQARRNLDLARVPKIHAETLAKRNAGIASLVDEFVVPKRDQLSGRELVRLDDAIAGLRKAVDEHQQWIENVLVPNAQGNFRIGRERYDEKLAFALDSSLGRDEIRRRAESEIVRVRGRMYQIARTLLQGKRGALALPDSPSAPRQQEAIEAALELAYIDHPKREELVNAARQTLADVTRFTREKDLVTLPDDPVKVILMPEFQRGVAGAYCDSPGPLDRGQPTYFALSPIPDSWSAEQAESFLREYNTRMLHLLSIHEGMPGHYLEGAHSNQHPSVLRAVLRSGMFAEGWAVYAENMMADAGYLDGDPLFRLVQLKFYLRSVANALLDQGVHVDGWTRERAMDLMVRQTFQQEREADGKWVRAQLTATQLPTYFVGAQEQFDLRKSVEEREGADFSLKRYHDAVLSYGAPPVRYVRELMLLHR